MKLKIIVNIITLIRLLYIIVLPILKVEISNIAYIINIILIFLTDFVDGILARKFKVQTLFGAIMDTVADKALCIVLLLALLPENPLLLYILIFEIVISIVNTIGMALKKKTKSSILGKIKMWIISITIILGYIEYFNLIDFIFVEISSIITIGMQIAVIIGYILNVKKADIVERTGLKESKKENLMYVLFDTEYYISNFK